MCWELTRTLSGKLLLAMEGVCAPPSAQMSPLSEEEAALESDAYPFLSEHQAASALFLSLPLKLQATLPLVAPPLLFAEQLGEASWGAFQEWLQGTNL